MRGLTLTVVVAVAACAGESGSGAAVTRDSAGVKIVENSGPAWEEGRGWQVADSPTVDIGARGGEPAYELDQVRGPVRFSNGGLAIANASTNDIRIYDGSGKHLTSSGRAGTGPGEYQNIIGVWLGPADSLLIADVLVRRLTVLDRDGKVGRAFSLGGQGGALVPTNGRVEFALPLGWFADGSVVGLSQAFAINQDRAGVFRDSLTMIRYGPDGSVRDTIGRVPGIEMEQMKMTVGNQTFSAPTAVPLGRQTVTAVGSDRLFLAQNNTWEIEIRDLDGKLQTIVRSPRQATRLTPSDVAAHRKEQLDAMEAAPMMRGVPDPIKRQITARVEQAKYPETLPYFTSLLTDAAGNLWAQEATPPLVKSQRYAVVDSGGRWLGVVTMPADFRPTFIGTDAVYGVWKDADELEHVRGYPLRKP